MGKLHNNEDVIVIPQEVYNAVMLLGDKVWGMDNITT